MKSHLAVFGLQSQLVPADGLDVSGLGQDLDAFGRLHQERAGGRLQPENTQRQSGHYTVCLILIDDMF